jgi:hypothetical protein
LSVRAEVQALTDKVTALEAEKAALQAQVDAAATAEPATNP